MKMTMAAILGFITLFSATEANASSWCVTRGSCRWWAQKFTANAVVACCTWPPVVRCANHGASCGTTSASCGWQSCPLGGAQAWATNGPSGCFHGGSRTGLGVYGTPVPGEDADESSAGSHEVASRVDFYPDQGTVQLSLDAGQMTASNDGSFSRLDVYLYKEDPDAMEANALLGLDEDEGELVSSPEAGIWHGAVVIQDGAAYFDGFDPDDFKITSEGDLTMVSFAGVKTEIPFDGTPEEFEQLAVRVITDGGFDP